MCSFLARLDRGSSLRATQSSLGLVILRFPLVFDKKFYLCFCIQTKSSAFRQVYRHLRSDESSCTLIDYRARLMMVHNGNGFVRSQFLDTKTPGVATAAAVPIERKLVKYVGTGMRSARLQV